MTDQHDPDWYCAWHAAGNATEPCTADSPHYMTPEAAALGYGCRRLDP